MKKNYLFLLIAFLCIIKLQAQRIGFTNSISSPHALFELDNELYIYNIYGELYKMDLNTPGAIPEVVIYGLPTTFNTVYNDSNIYMTDFHNNTINKLDLTTTPPSVSTIIENTDSVLYGLAIYNNYLYYTTYYNGKLMKFDLTLPTPVKIEVLPEFTGCFDIAIKGDELYFTNVKDHTLSKIDLTVENPEVDELLTNINLGGGLAFNGDDLYISSYTSDTIIKINITDENIVKTVFDSGSLQKSFDLVIHNDYLYIAEWENSRVSKIPLKTIILDSNVSCNGNNDGEITAIGNGGTPPYTYLWNNGDTTASLSNIPVGTYTVTISDNDGYTTIDSITITEPEVLVVNITIDSNATCYEDSNGGVTAIVNGGTAPYTYLWSNGDTTASITGIQSGYYKVRITDDNGCTTGEKIYLDGPIIIDTPQDIKASGPYEWIDGNTYTESTYGVTHTLTNIHGCDSIITLYLTLIDYCSSRSTRNRFEWIKQVELGTDIDNLTNQDANGYGDYTDQLLTVDTGDIVTVALTPGYKRRAYVEYWRIWADWNFDGDFNDLGEKVFEQKGKNIRTGSFTIPADVDSNELGLRVSMRWKRYAPACGNFSNGEVEDYKIKVNNALGSPYSDQDGKLQNPQDISTEPIYEFVDVFPNPISKGRTLSGYIRTEEIGEHQIHLVNTLGQTIKTLSIHSDNEENYFEISTEGLTTGLYFMNINGGNNSIKVIVK